MVDHDEVLNEVRRIAAEFSGDLGFSATNLRTLERIQWNAAEPFPVSGVIKLPILVTLLHCVEKGQVALDKPLVMSSEDRVPGSGVLKLLSGGLRLTVGDAAILMTSISDNTATNLVLDELGGISVVNDAMTELGLHTIRLLNRLDFDIIGPDIAHLAVASSADLDTLAFMVASGTAFTPTISAAAERVLSNQQDLRQVLRYIGVAPYAEELRLVQPVVTATQTGFYPGVRSDAGIVRFSGGGFSFSASTRASKEKLFSPEDEGEVANGRIGRVLMQHWWPPQNGAPPIIDSPYVSQGLPRPGAQ